MKKQDIIFILFIVFLFTPFFISDAIFNFYDLFNKEHGMVTSFIKFAVLATTGELIGLRIKTGYYLKTGFGLLPRAIVWGLLGLTIKLAFVIFTSGTISFLEYMGLENVSDSFKGDISFNKVLIALSISTFMNLIYAPILMTLHKITDTHIENNNGEILCLIRPIKIQEILKNINWDVHWNFVLKKTIVFFWIPAHTITFLLPIDYQVLFAALLGIALGIILAVASIKSKK